MIPSGEALDQVAFSEALSKAGGTALVAPNAEAAGLARISNVVAEAVAMALPGPESDEEMSLQVLVDRIVDELFGEAGLDTGDSEFLLELLETRYPAAQQQDNGDDDPAAAGRGWPSLGVLLSSLVRMPEAAGNTNDTVQILKSLLGLTDEKAPSLGKADGSAQAVGITDGKAQALGIADRKNPAPRPSDDQPRNDRGAAIAELASRIRTSLTSALPGRQDVATGANGEVRSGGNGPLETASQGAASKAWGQGRQSVVGAPKGAPPQQAEVTIERDALPAARTSEANSASRPAPTATTFVTDEGEGDSPPRPFRMAQELPKAPPDPKVDVNVSRQIRASGVSTFSANGEQPAAGGRNANEWVTVAPNAQPRDETSTAAPAGSRVLAPAPDPVYEGRSVANVAERASAATESALGDRPMGAPPTTLSGPANPIASVPQTEGAPEVQARPDVPTQIVRAAQMTIERGGGTVRIQLEPPELGRINLEIKVANNGTVSMHIVSNNADAKMLVQSQLPDLQSALQDRGFEVDELTVSVNDQDESSEAEDEAQMRARSGVDASEEDVSGYSERNLIGRPDHDGLIDYRV